MREFHVHITIAKTKVIKIGVFANTYVEAIRKAMECVVVTDIQVQEQVKHEQELHSKNK